MMSRSASKTHGINHTLQSHNLRLVIRLRNMANLQMNLSMPVQRLASIWTKSMKNFSAKNQKLTLKRSDFMKTKSLDRWVMTRGWEEDLLKCIRIWTSTSRWNTVKAMKRYSAIKSNRKIPMNSSRKAKRNSMKKSILQKGLKKEKKLLS